MRTASGPTATPGPPASYVNSVWRVTKAGNLIFNRALANGYTGPRTRFKSLGKFQRTGRYVTQMSFRPNRGSVYKACASSFRGFTVRR